MPKKTQKKKRKQAARHNSTLDKPVLSLRYPLWRIQRIQAEFGLSRSRAMRKAIDDAFEMYFGSAAN